MPDDGAPGAGAAPGPDAAGLPVTVRGLHRGWEVASEGRVELGDSALTLVVGGAPTHRPARRRKIVVRYDALEGARLEGGQLTLFVAGGDLLELSALPDSAGFAALVADRACAFPEQTLALRGLGSGRANPGSDHDHFFAPLLGGRRRAEDAAQPAGRVAAFAAAPLRAAVARTLGELAAERFPDRPADRRALEAELDELAEPLFASLEALASAQAAVTASPDDVRFVRFREWAAAVGRVFAAADRCWIAMASALPAPAAPPGRPGRFWRRVLRLGALLAATHGLTRDAAAQPARAPARGGGVSVDSPAEFRSADVADQVRATWSLPGGPVANGVRVGVARTPGRAVGRKFFVTRDAR